MSQHKDDRVQELFEWIKAEAKLRGDYVSVVDGIPARAKKLGLKYSSKLEPKATVRDFSFVGSRLVIRHDDENGWQLIDTRPSAG